MPICKFFTSPKGCEYGADCRFIHQQQPIQSSIKDISKDDSNPKQPKKLNVGAQEFTLQMPIAKVERKPVSKPIPVDLKLKLVQEEDPAKIASIIRTKEIDQLKKRFDATVISFASGETKLSFEMKPTDPDFPYELEALKITLTVPPSYPTSRKIAVFIANQDIPSDLVEHLKNEMERAARFSTMSLLDVIKWTDRELEKILLKKPMEEPEVKMQFLNFAEGKAKPTLLDREAYYGGVVEDEIVLEKDEDESSQENQSDDAVSESNSEDGEEEEDGTSLEPTDAKQSNIQASGTHLRAQDVRLINISLYQVSLLSIAVRCFRCKTGSEFRRLQPSVQNPTQIVCSKCSSQMSAKFFHELAHSTNNHLGRLQLKGCSVYDILPSEFLLSCQECSQELTVKNVYVGSTRNNCRKCHLEMEIFFSAIKLLVIGQTLALKTIKKPRDKELVGITKGDPLPKNGICTHYKRSFRWFRFPCCGKIFPCDICHEDENKDGHQIEWATRMICGFCSKEQQYSQKPCSCGKSLTGKTSAFWNAGKGMRDQLKMNRNESKKYAGLTKTTSKKKRNATK